MSGVRAEGLRDSVSRVDVARAERVSGSKAHGLCELRLPLRCTREVAVGGDERGRCRPRSTLFGSEAPCPRHREAGLCLEHVEALAVMPIGRDSPRILMHSASASAASISREARARKRLPCGGGTGLAPTLSTPANRHVGLPQGVAQRPRDLRTLAATEARAGR